MKKIASILTVVLLCGILFSGCGKTDATKAAEELIAAIGEVNADSGDAIDAAREAVDALTEDEQKKVKNTKKLEQAEEEYKEISDFNKSIAAVIKAAEASFSKDDFNVTELLKKADEIETQYNEMSDERKAQVKDYDKLSGAKGKLSSFSENALQAAAQYVKAFNNVNKDKKYTVTAVYCIKQIRNDADEYHLFALTYKDSEKKETTVYSHARCTTEVAASAIEARPETFFAEDPVSDDANAKECGNVEINMDALLSLLG